MPARAAPHVAPGLLAQVASEAEGAAEPLAQFWERAGGVWNSAATAAHAPGGRTIALVAHSAIISAMLCRCLGLGPERLSLFRSAPGRSAPPLATACAQTRLLKHAQARCALARMAHIGSAALHGCTGCRLRCRSQAGAGGRGSVTVIEFPDVAAAAGAAGIDAPEAAALSAGVVRCANYTAHLGAGLLEGQACAAPPVLHPWLMHHVCLDLPALPAPALRPSGTQARCCWWLCSALSAAGSRYVGDCLSGPCGSQPCPVTCSGLRVGPSNALTPMVALRGRAMGGPHHRRRRRLCCMRPRWLLLTRWKRSLGLRVIRYTPVMAGERPFIYIWSRTGSFYGLWRTSDRCFQQPPSVALLQCTCGEVLTSGDEIFGGCGVEVRQGCLPHFVVKCHKTIRHVTKPSGMHEARLRWVRLCELCAAC